MHMFILSSSVLLSLSRIIISCDFLLDYYFLMLPTVPRGPFPIGLHFASAFIIGERETNRMSSQLGVCQ